MIRKSRFYLFFIGVLLWMLFGWISLSARTDDGLTGKKIMERVGDFGGLGLKNAVANVRMILKSSDGGMRERFFIVRTKISQGLRKMILKFLSPPDVAGTGLLLIEKNKNEQEQFLYLPETGKVRKISGKQSHTNFLSSDFLYWDLKHHDVDDAEYERLNDEEVSGIKCRVVRSIPHQNVNSPYGYLITWVAVSNDVPVKIEFFDLAGKKIKRLINSRIEKKGGSWIVMESQMTDLRNEHSTILKVEKVDFINDMPDDEFTKMALQRVE